jgi:fatty acid desaturase (delta-4 desaturase)
VGRDCTALFESYHLRPDVAVNMLKRLPILNGFPVDAVPRSPYPNDSDFYNTVRERVRTEIFKGTEIKGAHRTGSEWAAGVILAYAAVTYTLYAFDANPITGFLLGLAGAWIGLTIQHCGNHGAMSTNPLVNNALGMTDDLIGGSSLMWRYHHQVSHHIHCNDDALDEDVLNAFPFLRFDPRLPKLWMHQFQHIYMWFTFPLLTVVFQIGDIKGLFDKRTVGASLYGASNFEKATVIAGKITHYFLLFGLPWILHGASAALIGAASYYATQGLVLASTFAVSHNVPESKPVAQGPAQDSLLLGTLERDWGVQQLLTSANWGGVIGNFFTGGLNLQIEHHLFPAISFMHYPAIAKIVEDEATKRGLQYAKYGTLPEIIVRFIQYMKDVGNAPQAPLNNSSSYGDLVKL